MNKKIQIAAFILASSVIINKHSIGATDEYVAGVKDKTVNINGETGVVSGTSSKLDFLGKIYGGKSETASTTNNKIEATKMGKFFGTLYGGYTEGNLKSANGNTINYAGNGTDESSIAKNIIGGKSKKGEASDNEIYISGVKKIYSGDSVEKSYIHGGIAGEPENVTLPEELKKTRANKNIVKITGVESGTSIGVDITGGKSIHSGARENKIILTKISEITKNKNFPTEIIAAEGINTITKNKVEITGIESGATLKSNITGARGAEGSIFENSVKLDKIKEIESSYIIGAQATGVPSAGGIQIGSSVSGNKVEIIGIETGAILSTEITGGLVQQGHSNNNQVNLMNIKGINQDIYGGRDKEQEGSIIINSIRGAATLPTAPPIAVPIINGEIGDAVASQNEVLIVGISDGATLTANVYGGHIEKDSVRGGDIYAEENIVTLVNVRSNENIETDVYGGFARSNSEDKVNINNNQVVVAGNTDLSNTNLYGGIAYTSLVPGTAGEAVLKDNFEGNILHIGIEETPWHNTKGKNAVKSLRGFQTIQFNSIHWDENKAALTILEESDLSNTEIKADKICFTNIQQLNDLGKQMTLVNTNGNDDKIKEENINSGEKKFTVGTGLEGEGEAKLAENGKDVIYVIKQKDDGGNPDPADPVDPTDPNNPGGNPDLNAQPQTHNVMIGNIASLVSVNGGQSFIEEGISSKLKEGKYGPTFFMAAKAGTEKYKTGSHVNTDIINGVVGIGNIMEMANGDLGYMAFYEYGKGNYKVKNSAGREGDGDIRYHGLAFGTKYRFKNDYYIEGSARGGHVKNHANDVLSDGIGNSYSYDTSSHYLGGHFGVGKVVKLSHDMNLDGYGKFMYSHIAKDDFNIGDEYKLDAVESKILKVGAKLTQKFNSLELQYGLGLEHEFDGKAKGYVEGIAIESASIKGTSGVFEIGMKLMPSPESAWEFGAGIKGYVGKHRGLRGDLAISYRF